MALEVGYSSLFVESDAQVLVLYLQEGEGSMTLQ